MGGAGNMAHLILDDGGPDATEYYNNRIEFDEDDPHVLDRLFRVLCGTNQADPEIRQSVRLACRSSVSNECRGETGPRKTR